MTRSVEDLNASISAFSPPSFVDDDPLVMLVHLQHTGFCELDLSTLTLTPAGGRYGEHLLASEKGDPFMYAHRLPGGMRFLFGSYWGSHMYGDQAKGVRVHFALPTDQPGGVVARPTRVLQDPVDPSIFWVASRFGLRRFSDRELTFDTYVVSGTNADFASTNFFNDLVIDRHGQKWLASNSGLIKISKLAWLFQDQGVDGLPGFRDIDFGKTVTDASGSLWVASFDRGIFHVEPRKEPVPLPRWRSNLASGANITFDLRMIDGVPYAATDRGILRYNAASGRFDDTGWVPDSLLRNEAAAVCTHLDTQGEWWCGVGRGGGLVRIRSDGQRTVYNHYNAKPGTPLYLPIRYPSVIAEDGNGDLWMGLPRVEGMLVRWRRATERFDTVRVDLGSLQLLRLAITDLRFDSTQNLWATTYSHGMLRRDACKGTWTQFGVREGLRSNDVTAAAFDASGNLWVSTFNGIAVLQHGTNRFRAFSMEDGMPHAHVSWLGFPYPDQPDRMLVTGTGYVHAVDARILLQPLGPLRVAIERIDVESQPHALHDEANFRYDQSHFEFFFGAVNLVNGPDNRYRYKLEGLDDRWVDAGGLRSANYANVPPGRYVFRVKADNANIGWSEPASFSFVVAAPFWQRWWFYTLVAFACAAVIYLVYRVRIDRLLEMERVRTNISRDLHDDIGSTLSSINLLAHATRSRLTDADQQRVDESLVRIGERTQRMLDSMKDIIWSIKPENDALPNVLARMREYASSTLEAKQIEATINFPSNVNNLQLQLELKNNLYLVFKEAVNNLAKYSGATRANIELTISNRSLKMVVQDNGLGFDPAALRCGNGLNNMQRRAQESGAQLTVESSPGGGTSVVFLVPRLP